MCSADFSTASLIVSSFITAFKAVWRVYMHLPVICQRTSIDTSAVIAISQHNSALLAMSKE